MESCLNYFWQNLSIPFSLHFLFVSILLNLVKRARLPNCRILLTRHDFVTSPRPVASLGVPAIATLGVLHVRQHVNELFCGEAGIEPLLAPKNRYPTYWFFYSVALPLSYSPAFTSWISKSELSHFPGRIFDRYTSCNRIWWFHSSCNGTVCSCRCRVSCKSRWSSIGRKAILGVLWTSS